MLLTVICYKHTWPFTSGSFAFLEWRGWSDAQVPASQTNTNQADGKKIWCWKDSYKSGFDLREQTQIHLE